MTSRAEDYRPLRPIRRAVIGNGGRHLDPAREDAVTRREDAQMYDRWHRLRDALRRAR